MTTSEKYAYTCSMGEHVYSLSAGEPSLRDFLCGWLRILFDSVQQRLCVINGNGKHGNN